MKRSLYSKSKVLTFRSIPLLLALFLLPLFSFGQDLDVISRPVTVDIQGKFGYNTYQFMQDPRTQKIGSDLLAVLEMYDKGMDLTTDTMIHVAGNKVSIQAFARSVAEGQDLLNSLTAMGMTGGAVHKHIVNGMLPFDKIESTMELASLRSISLAFRPKARVGAVTSQADVSMASELVRSQIGVDGSGLKIGILSDSYNSLGAAAAGVASGDLPGPGNPNRFEDPVEVLMDLTPASDEGRAMAELIHDVAPGSKLAFHTAFGGPAVFANGIIALRQAGCDVIVDDVFYLLQPYFQDDIIGQAADAVVADGALYFSAAGNTGNTSYDEAFAPGGFLFDFGGGLVYEPHDWGGGDYFLQVTIPPGAALNFWLQWDEPSLLAGLIGPEQDLDVVVFNENLTAIIAGSFLDNNGIGLPLEFIQRENETGAPLTLNLFVGRFGPVAGNPGRFKFIDFSGAASFYENSAQINKSTVVGHPNTNGAIAVGAAAYFNTPAFGVSPALINGFSSVGGTPILFDPIGNRLPTPELRLKPDLTGPDGTNTTFFIPGLDVEPDGFPNFFGTSASAPNVAALGALLKQFLPRAPNATIKSILLETAMEMDDPRGINSNIGTGNFDFATGFGFVDGAAALTLAQEIKNIPTMSEWGLILFSLLIISLGLATTYSVQFAPAASGGAVLSRPRFKLFFDRTIFYRKLPAGLGVLALGALVILIFWGEILMRDIVGLTLALPLVTYILHMVEVFKEEG